MEHRIGAIPFDIKNDRIALLFVTSQGRGRWIWPKGKLKKGESHKQGCKREAFEEAGVRGFVIEDAPLTNLITKSTKDGTADVAVTYYPLYVEEQFDKWPEEKTRQRHWALLEDSPRVTDRQDFLSIINQLKALKPLILQRSKQKIKQQQEKQKPAP
jgi:8-oxo-dGTP pyrophosphatase MutT (NUDIX family)